MPSNFDEILGAAKAKPTPEVETEPTPSPAPAPKTRKTAKKRSPSPLPKQEKKTAMQQLIDKQAEKEPTVRITIDIPKSLHRRLSMFCAQNQTKKATVVRALLDEALQDIED